MAVVVYVCLRCRITSLSLPRARASSGVSWVSAMPNWARARPGETINV